MRQQDRERFVKSATKLLADLAQSKTTARATNSPSAPRRGLFASMSPRTRPPALARSLPVSTIPKPQGDGGLQSAFG